VLSENQGDRENNFKEEILSEYDRLEDLFSKQLIAVHEKNDVKTAPISSGDVFTF
jgi:hypothetical protein